MNLTHGEIGDLISALTEAIEANEINIDSNDPHKPRKMWSAKEKADHATWKQNLRVYRRLRKKLANVEDGWEPVKQVQKSGRRRNHAR